MSYEYIKYLSEVRLLIYLKKKIFGVLLCVEQNDFFFF